MTRPVQYFSDAYLAQCRQMTPTQIGRFLDNFRRVAAKGQTKPKRTLISIRVPDPLLQAFKLKAQSAGLAYQTQIQRLMQQWLLTG